MRGPLFFFAALLFPWSGGAAENPPEDWSLHGQATAVPQYHPPIKAPYSGTNSLSSQAETRVSITSTLFLGRRLWTGGEVFLNPEITGGSGFSVTRGLAAFPNGEIYRVDSADPRVYLSRFFLRQNFNFGGGQEAVETGANQLAKSQDIHRLTLTVGKLSLNDVFDANAYSHDPRTQFLNWVFMDNGAWDYAADTRGYTWMLLAEYNRADWTLRAATSMVPASANGLDFDMTIARAHGDNAELEYRYQLGQRPGKVRLLAYINHARMGHYRTAVDAGGVPDVTLSRQYRAKYGLGLNLEQEITPEVGLFSRLGWNDGKTETWAFTEIEQFFSLGLSLKGSLWGRSEDQGGVAFALSGLSKEHAEYFRRGGVGFIAGDGQLNYGLEMLGELYYSFRVVKNLSISPDFQLILNPAFNQDRGPVSVFTARVHYEL